MNSMYAEVLYVTVGSLCLDGWNSGAGRLSHLGKGCCLNRFATIRSYSTSDAGLPGYLVVGCFCTQRKEMEIRQLTCAF